MSSKINWDKDILPHVRTCISEFERNRVKPTLRTIFYWLVSKNLIPNTKHSYKSLSRSLVRWRKKGYFPWDVITDKVRVTYGRTAVSHNISESVVSDYTEKLEKTVRELTLSDILDRVMPEKPSLFLEKWAGQRNIVEVWLEKEALAETILRWTAFWNVKIRVNRGYSSWTFIYMNVEDLKNILKQGSAEKVNILYLGDLDPSGKDIERFLREALEYFGLSSDTVSFERVAVTEEQVREYNLPAKPEDEETIRKLSRDPRSRKYYGVTGRIPTWELLRFIRESGKATVELDALVAFVPEEFRKLLENEISRYWSRETWLAMIRRKEELEKKIEYITAEYREKLKKKILEILREN